jgi:hypothetical protein
LGVGNKYTLSTSLFTQVNIRKARMLSAD